MSGMLWGGQLQLNPPSENQPGNEDCVAERMRSIATRTDKLTYFKYDIVLCGLYSSEWVAVDESHPKGPKTRTSDGKVMASVFWDAHEILIDYLEEDLTVIPSPELFTSSSPVPLKTRRVGQRCTLNLSRAETSSRWCGVVVRRGGCQLRCRPRHLTMVQNYVVRRQKPSCS
ncbi:uncharacterized protein TNCV_4703181 [Trichonephila clavipes]|nr:uncharacterized protein TNCV_4703181 [Trichonephila clavipes]